MTDSSPERRPTTGGHLRASDADRDAVAAVLNTAYAESRITRDEHVERLEAALAARTFDDLVPITADLVPTAPPGLVPARDPHASYQIDTRDAHADPDVFVAVFGGATRKGRWRVRKRNQAYAVFGGIDLDLREAVFEDPVVEIAGAWVFGGLDVKVPEGVEVRDQTVGIFGGTDIKDVGEPQPGAPTVVVKGLSLFGGVSIRGPRRSRRERWGHGGHPSH